MKKIRTVLVGLGRIGWAYHLPQISSSKNFELTAVVDPMQERLDEVTGKFPACHGYKNYDESTEAKDYEDKLQVSSYLNLLYKYT